MSSDCEATVLIGSHSDEGNKGKIEVHAEEKEYKRRNAL